MIEKFYNSVEWIEYLADNFLAPWGYKLEGSVSYQGEESDDRGRIYVKYDEEAKKHLVEDILDEISNPGPSWGKEAE